MPPVLANSLVVNTFNTRHDQNHSIYPTISVLDFSFVSGLILWTAIRRCGVYPVSWVGSVRRIMWRRERYKDTVLNMIVICLYPERLILNCAADKIFGELHMDFTFGSHLLKYREMVVNLWVSSINIVHLMIDSMRGIRGSVQTSLPSDPP